MPTFGCQKHDGSGSVAAGCMNDILEKPAIPRLNQATYQRKKTFELKGIRSSQPENSFCAQWK